MKLVVYLKYEAESGLLDFLTGFTPVIEPCSVGEVFLEMPRAGIRNLLRELGRAGFRVVAGTGTNPLMARAAVLAGLRDPGRFPGLIRTRVPDGGIPVYVVGFGAEVAFISALPVELLWPLPAKTRLALRGLSLITAGDIARVGEPELRMHFGAIGSLIAAYSRGLDHRRVRSLYPPPEFSWRRTLEGAVARPVLEEALIAGAQYLAGSLRREFRGYRCLRLEIGLEGGRRLEGERCFPAHIAPDPGKLGQQLRLLLDGLEIAGPVYELWVVVSKLYRLEPEQVDLFSMTQIQVADGLTRTVTALEARYPGRLVRGRDFQEHCLRRERMLAFYDPYRGRLLVSGEG